MMTLPISLAGAGFVIILATLVVITIVPQRNAYRPVATQITYAKAF